MKRGTRSAYRARTVATERMIDDAKAEVAAAAKAEWDARQAAAREQDAARVRFTAMDLAEATHVRDRYGWHRTVRINGKSVTVLTPYTWVDRIPLGNILDYRVIHEPIVRYE